MERQSRLVYLGEIAGSLAHEIRNPLNTINMNVQLLEEQLVDKEEAVVKKIHRVRNEVIRLDGILTSFLRFARPPKLSLKKVDVRELLIKIEEFFGPEVEGAGIHLEVNLEEDLPPVHGDSEQLRQLFLNLLLNARDATPRGGNIVISAWKTPRRVHIAVEDTGCGIEKKKLDKIFEPYVTTKENGTGVGLAIVRRIVMDHGGSIRVESTVGAGTTFTVSLPRR
jgi:signal transduction histidine kinase